ncbi:TVP38/TMEM64 family protein [Paenibacillus pedocola]|uniref:TVP38/TMEM64 family protein n=1 Tax=Paenibacillus pedocola TaxID=3242193 RepID=UPI002877E556|nr:VTT domain-containing protein [Paenibacillus typhae]
MEYLVVDSELLMRWLMEWGAWAVLISLLINVVISVVGIIPSVALTIVNMLVFGVVPGFLLSWVGEVLGAAVSYLLYRKGTLTYKEKYRPNKTIKWLSQIQTLNPKRQFFSIIIARSAPLIPSSLVTLICVISKIGFSNFIVASAIGKIPSLLLEALIGYGYVNLLNYKF